MFCVFPSKNSPNGRKRRASAGIYGDFGQIGAKISRLDRAAKGLRCDSGSEKSQPYCGAKSRNRLRFRLRRRGRRRRSGALSGAARDFASGQEGRRGDQSGFDLILLCCLGYALGVGANLRITISVRRSPQGSEYSSTLSVFPPRVLIAV